MMWLYPGAPRQKEALFMTLQQLAYLVAVAECGSITDAAELPGILRQAFHLMRRA